jgi:hypothetical protein
MAKATGKRGSNPLKQTKRGKTSTRARADQGRGSPRRQPASETVTRQGGARKGGRRADTAHPSQHGGIKRDMDPHGPE